MYVLISLKLKHQQRHWFWQRRRILAIRGFFSVTHTTYHTVDVHYHHQTRPLLPILPHFPLPFPSFPPLQYLVTLGDTLQPSAILREKYIIRFKYESRLLYALWMPCPWTLELYSVLRSLRNALLLTDWLDAHDTLYWRCTNISTYKNYFCQS